MKAEEVAAEVETGNLANGRIRLQRNVVVGRWDNWCPHCVPIQQGHPLWREVPAVYPNGSKPDARDYRQGLCPLAVEAIADDDYCGTHLCVECVRELLAKVDAATDSVD